MGTYGIDVEEFLEGHLNTNKNEEGYYGFKEFLQDFEGDVNAETVAEGWNKLSKKFKWGDKLKVVKDE